MSWDLLIKRDYTIQGKGQIEYTYELRLMQGKIYRHVTEDVENEFGVIRRTESMVFVPA